jgi:N utilization substance protein A
MVDLKTIRAALEQLEAERGISKDKILLAIEDALVAAYKKDYGKKDQIIRARFDEASGALQFTQIKIVSELVENEESQILLADAQKIKQDAQVGEELLFPLETKDDYGRIAAQTAKQVILQRIREAERAAVLAEYSTRAGSIVSGKVQKIERGNVFVDLGRTVGMLSREEQIPGEYYRQGERIKCYLVAVEETPRGVNLRLSRANPQFVERLFAVEAPEIASGAVMIKAIAREPGARTKLAALSTNPNIDPVGSCVGQRGVRVNTVINELGGEKIDIMEWSNNPEVFITNALSPAKISAVKLFPEEMRAEVVVEADQFSLAIGRGGQNVRLASRLTGWKLDINSLGGEREVSATEPAPSQPLEANPPVQKDEPLA